MQKDASSPARHAPPVSVARMSDVDQAARATARATALSAARASGLRYASDARPGIRRLRAGRGFTYRDADGSTDSRSGSA